MGRKGGPPDYGGRGIQGIVVQHNKYNQALEEDFPGIEHAPEENEEGKQQWMLRDIPQISEDLDDDGEEEEEGQQQWIWRDIPQISDDIDDDDDDDVDR